jgi:hypothetical protein
MNEWPTIWNIFEYYFKTYNVMNGTIRWPAIWVIFEDHFKTYNVIIGTLYILLLLQNIM